MAHYTFLEQLFSFVFYICTKEYYVEFYRCLDLPEVLVLCYEDLQVNLAGHHRPGQVLTGNWTAGVGHNQLERVLV